MSTTLTRGADSFLSRYEGLRSQLPGDPAPRDAAAAAFRNAGLPGPRTEAWKYTSLRSLAELGFREPLTAVDTDGMVMPTIPDLDCPRLVFVDGRLRPDLSTLPSGMGFSRFADSPDFGGQTRPDRDPVVALNTMLAEDGACLTIPAGTDAGTLLLVNVAAESEGRSIAFHPRHSIRLERGAKLLADRVGGRNWALPA